MIPCCCKPHQRRTFVRSLAGEVTAYTGAALARADGLAVSMRGDRPSRLNENETRALEDTNYR
jgi:hypothetical protein